MQLRMANDAMESALSEVASGASGETDYAHLEHVISRIDELGLMGYIESINTFPENEVYLTNVLVEMVHIHPGLRFHLTFGPESCMEWLHMLHELAEDVPLNAPNEYRYHILTMLEICCRYAQIYWGHMLAVQKYNLGTMAHPCLWCSTLSNRLPYMPLAYERSTGTNTYLILREMRDAAFSVEVPGTPPYGSTEPVTFPEGEDMLMFEDFNIYETNSYHPFSNGF